MAKVDAGLPGHVGDLDRACGLRCLERDGKQHDRSRNARREPVRSRRLAPCRRFHGCGFLRDCGHFQEDGTYGNPDAGLLGGRALSASSAGPFMGVAGMAVISCDGALPRVRPSEGWLLIDGWGGVPVGFEKRVRLSRPGQAGSSDRRIPRWGFSLELPVVAGQNPCEPRNSRLVKPSSSVDGRGGRFRSGVVKRLDGTRLWGSQQHSDVL